MKRSSIVWTFGFVIAAGSATSCVSDDAEPTCEDGSCDVQIGRCDVADRSGGALRADLADPVAKKIFAGTGACPMSFRQVMDSLKSCDNVQTRVVETQAQHLAAADSTFSAALKTVRMFFGGAVPELGGYHTVTSVDCGSGGPADRVLILQSRSYLAPPTGRDGKPFALDATSQWETDGLKKPLELIAFDKTRGVFNYYSVEPPDEKGATPCAAGGSCAPFEWLFHGDSKSYLQIDSDLKPTAKFSIAPTVERRCGACHTGGGLVMRELNRPWINWVEDFSTPGASELIAAHKELGSDVGGASGFEMEQLVLDGNALWDPARIKYASSATQLANNPAPPPNPNVLLKPLFCTNEINVQSKFPGADVTDVDGSFFFDDALDNPGIGLNFDASIYDRLAPSMQVVPNIGTTPAAPFLAFGITDTAGKLMIPERSGADLKYVAALVDAKLIDEATVQAVLAVDFTRPIFSDTRCNLLRDMKLTWADVTTPSGNVTAARVKAALAKKAGALSSAGAKQLVENLKAPAGLTTRIEAFAAACTARGATEAFMRDILTVANRMRERAYAEPIFAIIPTSMPKPKSSPGNVRLNPLDCTLETMPAGQ